MRAPILVRPAPPDPVPWEPDPVQELLARHRGPGVLIGLGAPGTGKSTSVVRSLLARHEEGVDPDSTLVLAFSRERARDLRAMMAARLPLGALPRVTTFHGLAFDIVGRAALGDPDGSVPRLLSGAEEDVRIRELLRGAVADASVDWPSDLVAALPTLGLANDVRAFLARTRDLGISPEQLMSAGRALDRPEWIALAAFADLEADVMALEDLVDYSALVASAIGLVQERPELVAPVKHLDVDDFHEADPLQRQLLTAICRHGASATVYADPDTCVFGFRGADRLGAIRLVDDVGAAVVALNRVYRGGDQILSAYARVRRQPPLPGLPAAILRDYREPQDLTGVQTTLAVTSHDGLSDLAAHVAVSLRRRHLSAAPGSGLDWSDMAVLVPHSGDIEVLRRALESGGVPVRVAADAIALPQEPAVAVLLAALQAAVHPPSIGVREAVDLVMGPLGEVDAVGLRALGRELRRLHRVESGAQAAPPATQLVRDLLVSCAQGEPPLTGVADGGLPAIEAAERVCVLGRLLGRAHEAIEAGSQPADVLWMLWAPQAGAPGADPWPERLRSAALAGHHGSAHDLDAVLALFDAAERLSERYRGALGVEGFLAGLGGQRLPGESVSARALSIPAVEILTARLAVGRQWPHVVIVGAQEGQWPRLSMASSTVHADELELIIDGDLDADALARDAFAAHIADERRLFGLALSRASSHCHIAVVQRAGEAGDLPSRFVTDLQVPTIAQPGRPPRPLTLDGLVADLRSIAEDPDADGALRDAAAQRLALLAQSTTDEGESLVPLADPRTWWGVSALTQSARPVRPEDRPVSLSGSTLGTLHECPLKWFISRAARAQGPASSAIALGNIVHVLAERVGRGELAADPQVLVEYADQVWNELTFDAPWQGAAERAALAEALERLCRYHGESAARLVAVEHPFDVLLPVAPQGTDAGTGTEVVVRVTGSIDRVEVDASGDVHLVDLKTGRQTPTGPQVRADLQLGIYQAVVQGGALDNLEQEAVGAAQTTSTAAALVQLRHPESSAEPLRPKVQQQPPLDHDAAWLTDPVQTAVARIRQETFPAIPGPACRTCSFTAVCPAQSEPVIT